MKQSFFLIPLAAALLVLFAFLSCNDDPEPERTSIIAGVEEDAFFFSDLSEPDTMINDGVHSTILNLDLNGDGVDDITFLSAMDTLLDENNRPDSVFKTLTLTAAEATNGQSVLVSSSGILARPYGRAEVIEQPNNPWLSLIGFEVELATSTQSLTTGQSVVSGNWNGMIDSFLGIWLITADGAFLSWVGISVLNFDNYVLTNHASFELD